MKTFFSIAVAVMALVLVVSPGPAGAQVSFSQGYVVMDSAGVFLTIPEIRLGQLKGWVTWKLNPGNAAWEVSTAGLADQVPAMGPRTATGHYVYFPQKSLVVLEVSSSNFLGCGVDVGILPLDIQALSATQMTVSPVSPGDPTGDIAVPCTAEGGNTGGILGAWRCALGPAGTLLVTFNPGSTFTITGNMVNCLLD